MHIRLCTGAVLLRMRLLKYYWIIDHVKKIFIICVTDTSMIDYNTKFDPIICTLGDTLPYVLSKFVLFKSSNGMP